MAVKHNILGYVELLCKSLGIYQPDKKTHTKEININQFGSAGLTAP